MNERRSQDRVVGGLPGVALSDGEVQSQGILRDVSANGAFVYGAVGFQSGRCCTLEIEVDPDGPPFVVQAVVVRRDPIGCALEFQALPLQILARLHGRMRAAAAA